MKVQRMAVVPPQFSAAQAAQLESLWRQTLAAFQAGRYAEAQANCESLLKTVPQHPSALHVLGLCAHSLGDRKRALDALRRATTANPREPGAFNNLGMVLLEDGQVEAALKAIYRALALRPSYPEAQVNLGNALLQRSDDELALAAYDRALMLKPRNAEAHVNRANILQRRGDYAKAVQGYERALAVTPENADALMNMGVALHKLGRVDDAVAALGKAVGLAPQDAEAQANLGYALLDAGRPQDAVAACEQALALQPDSAAALVNLGMVQERLGLLDEAIACYEHAIANRPDLVEAHADLGNVQARRRAVGAAIAAYRQAMAIDPEFGEVRASLLHQLLHACAWEEAAALAPAVDRAVAAALTAGRPAPETPFSHVARNDDAALNLQVAAARAADIARRAGPAGFVFAAPEAGAGRRLRIGYLSSDIRNHAVGYLVRGLFAAHDRSQFDVAVYSHGPDDGGEVRQHVIATCDDFIDLRPASRAEAAEKIYRDRVDILVDLNGHTSGNRLDLCALRPAPIQATWLGFPSTSGADFFDYTLVDRIVAPPADRAHFSGALAYLPHCYLVVDDTVPVAADTPSRTDLGLPEDGVVCAALHHVFKLDPTFFAIWLRVVEAVPNCVLWLFRGNPEAEANLRATAEAQGVDPARLVFADWAPHDQHLARYRHADLCLDTRIYNGHTTTAEALWMGVPVVAMTGRHFASRVSASIFAAAGLPELATDTPAAYEALARALARDAEARAVLRTRIADARGTAPMFDTQRFARGLEAAYRAMWQRRLADEPPGDIDLTESPAA